MFEGVYVVCVLGVLVYDGSVFYGYLWMVVVVGVFGGGFGLDLATTAADALAAAALCVFVCGVMCDEGKVR